MDTASFCCPRGYYCTQWYDACRPSNSRQNFVSNSITRQAFGLQSCSNPLRFKQVAHLSQTLCDFSIATFADGYTFLSAKKRLCERQNERHVVKIPLAKKWFLIASVRFRFSKISGIDQVYFYSRKCTSKLSSLKKCNVPLSADIRELSAEKTQGKC